VIAAGGCDHARGRDVTHEEVGKGAAGLERAGVLQALQLHDDAAAQLDHRRPADVRPDDRLGGSDAGAVERVWHCVRHLAN
jgi:hypothetical protein